MQEGIVPCSSCVEEKWCRKWTVLAIFWEIEVPLLQPLLSFSPSSRRYIHTLLLFNTFLIMAPVMSSLAFADLEKDAHHALSTFRRNKIHRDQNILPPIDQKNIQQTVQITASCINPALEKIAEGQTGYSHQVHPDDPVFAGKLNELATKAMEIFNKYCPVKAKEWIASLQENIKLAVNKITNGNPQMKKAFAVIVFSLVVAIASAFISSRDNDLSYIETLKQMLMTVFPTLAFGALFACLQYLGTSQLIIGLKAATQALAVETFENTLSLIASGMIGFFVTILWDLFVAIYDNFNQNLSITDWVMLLGKSLLSSFQHNSLQAICCTTVAYLCPAWATVCICVVASVYISHLKEIARIRNENFYYTASTVTWSYISFIPQTLWYTLVGYPVFKGEYPDVFLCEVTYELLQDPVFFRGYIVSRQVAHRRVEDYGRDFYNLPATPDDILPIPQLDAVINKVRLYRR